MGLGNRLVLGQLVYVIREHEVVDKGAVRRPVQCEVSLDGDGREWCRFARVTVFHPLLL